MKRVVKALARKKREERRGNNAPWLNTFADLMNLLLCFFVLLFSKATIDEMKFEELSISFANSFGVLERGGTSIEQGNLISTGMSQLDNLGNFYEYMGKASTKSGSDITAPDQKNDEHRNNEGTTDENNVTDDTLEGRGDAILAEAIKRIEQEMEKETTKMYDKISDLAQQTKLEDYIELSMDSQYNYVLLTLKGSVLFDSGSAEIKEEAKPILTRVSDILAKFAGYSVEITGHTDNVPVTRGAYKDNKWLSSARALNAAEYLIKTAGLNPSLIKYSGRGEYEPVADNETPSGRAKNRRIEIKIYNEYSSKG
jgi:chemotaxis protein MotB